MKKCILYDRACTDCGECNRCDLDPNKICNNCCKCIESDKEYYEIKIDAVELPEDLPKFPNPKK